MKSSLTPIISCTSYSLAHKYFQQAAVYLPRIHAPGVSSMSYDFDYKSIMIYSSDCHMVPGSNRFPLLTIEGDQIFVGGHQDPRRAGLSPMDIERVTKLYPKESVDSHSKPAEPPGKPVTKRWWSVPDIHDVNANDAQPWPASADGSHTITFCFGSQAVWGELGEFFTRALAKWAVAIQASSLEFAPDPACDRSPCLCRTPGVADHTLHILQAVPGHPLFTARTSIGYQNPHIPRLQGLPRHYLIWPANTNQLGDASYSGLIMAHELGGTTRPRSSRNCGRN